MSEVILVHNYAFIYYMGIYIHIYMYIAYLRKYIKINVCLYVPFRIVNYASDHVIVFTKVLHMSQVRFLSWYDQFSISGAIEND